MGFATGMRFISLPSTFDIGYAGLRFIASSAGFASYKRERRCQAGQTDSPVLVLSSGKGSSLQSNPVSHFKRGDASRFPATGGEGHRVTHWTLYVQSGVLNGRRRFCKSILVRSLNKNPKSGAIRAQGPCQQEALR